MHFNSHGNLDGGIISVSSLSEIEEHLVQAFPDSRTRRRNFDAFCNFWNSLDKSTVTRIWLDGSFCTTKEDPNDIDCVIFIEPIKQNEDYFETLQKQHNQLKQNHLDVYVAPDKECIKIEPKTLEIYQKFDYQEKYWLGQFGFDRNRNHKAIIELRREV